MNAEEFVLWAKELGGVSSIPNHPFKNKWEEIYKGIEPHFYGKVPKVLRETFPNEDPAIYKYRKETYQPKTESCITESINKLSRLMQDSKYSISYQDDSVKEYFDNGLKVQGQTFQQFFLSKFPSKRALDPNGVFLADVMGEGMNNPSVRVDLDFKFIESKYIKLVDLDLGVLIYRAPTFKNKYKAVQSLQNTGVGELTNFRWYVVTDEFYGHIEIGDDSSQLTQVYEHEFGGVPFVIMGGRPLSEDYNGFQFYYFKSDLSSAIPFLNDAAVSDNQEKSTTIANAFPVKILQGVDCNDCGGQGFHIGAPSEEYPDGKRETCGTCKGTGQINLSPLNGIYTKKKPKYGSEGQAQEGPLLEFVSPNVGILDYLSGYSEKKYEQAKEVLNVEKAVKYAQSAVAKEVDNEPEHIEVKRISDDIFYRMNYMMLVIQYLIFNDRESSIFVIPPTSFDIKNEAELFEEYQKTISSKSPDFVRAAAFEDWLKQRFSTDKAGQKIAKICIGYAKAFLMTSEEQERYYLVGVYTKEDLIKASSVYNAVINEYNKDIEFLNQDLDTIYSQIDTILSPVINNATALPPPNVDPEEL